MRSEGGGGRSPDRRLNRPRVWIARTRPGADALAEKVSALGARALVAPLLEVQALAFEPPPTPGAIAFTSAHAVSALMDGVDATLARAIRAAPAYAVGRATAAALSDWRGPVTQAEGVGEALAGRLAADAAAGLFRPPVLLPGAQTRAFDLGSALAAAGVRTLRLDVYRTVETDPFPFPPGPPPLFAALLQSPRGAEALARRFAPDALPQCRFLAQSEAIAAPLRRSGFEKVWAAPFPDEAALLTLLAQHLEGSA